MTPYPPHRAPLPTVRLVERRHRLDPLPGPPLQLDLAPFAAAGRGLARLARAAAFAAVGLWPLTAVSAAAAALLACAGH